MLQQIGYYCGQKWSYFLHTDYMELLKKYSTCFVYYQTPMHLISADNLFLKICNSYTMGCPPVRGDNPRALASGLSYVQVDKHGITILCHLH